MATTTKTPRPRRRRRRRSSSGRPPTLTGVLRKLHPNPARRKARRQQLNEMSYQAYLFTEEWKEFRKGVLRRDKWACKICGTKVGLQVHHKTYRRIKRERPGDCHTLCEACHAHEHGKD